MTRLCVLAIWLMAIDMVMRLWSLYNNVKFLVYKAIMIKTLPANNSGYKKPMILMIRR